MMLRVKVVSECWTDDVWSGGAIEHGADQRRRIGGRIAPIGSTGMGDRDHCASIRRNMRFAGPPTSILFGEAVKKLVGAHGLSNPASRRAAEAE